MKKEKINNKHTIDLDTVDNDARCPDCGEEHFLSDVEVVKEPTNKHGTNGIYMNICINGHKSIHKDRKQYKKI